MPTLGCYTLSWFYGIILIGLGTKEKEVIEYAGAI